MLKIDHTISKLSKFWSCSITAHKVFVDREVWRRNIKLLHRNPQGKAVVENGKNSATVFVEVNGTVESKNPVMLVYYILSGQQQ